jgi:hypothetical protein
MSVAEAVLGIDTQTPPGGGAILHIASLAKVDHITPRNRAQMGGTYDDVTAQASKDK